MSNQPNELTCSMDKDVNRLLCHAKLYKSVNSKFVGTKLFALARGLRTLIGFELPKPSKQVKPILIIWYNENKQFLPEKSFDLIWSVFTKCWQYVTVPVGEDLFYELLLIAESSEYPPVAQNYEDVGKELVRLCAVLDAYWSPKPFYLSCRTASMASDYSPSAMAYILKLLVEDEVLELIKKGSMGRASRYKFLADKGTIDMRLIKSIQQVNKEVD